MPIDRAGLQNAGLIDVLDRILEKGIVIDAWVRVSLAGVELVTIEGRVVVASIQTYLERGAQLGPTTLAATPSVWRNTSSQRQEGRDDLMVS